MLRCTNNTMFSKETEMRILVVEDKACHRRSAEETLAGHEITIVESFDKAMDLIRPDQAPPYPRSLPPFPFEAVLADMMMPMSKRRLGEGVFKPDEEVPYGFIVALTAAHRGAKFVAVVTDTNHHHGAVSAALDYLGPDYYGTPLGVGGPGCPPPEPQKPTMFNINGSRVVFVHAPFVDKSRKDWGGKDWGRVLTDLMR